MPSGATGSREGALENLRSVVEALPTIKKCVRGATTRDEFGFDTYPFAVVLNPVDSKEFTAAQSAKMIVKPILEVYVQNYTQTQMEALYLEVWMGIIADPQRGGNASNTIVGNYDPVDYLPNVQGFTLEMDIVLFVRL